MNDEELREMIERIRSQPPGTIVKRREIGFLCEALLRLLEERETLKKGRTE